MINQVKFASRTLKELKFHQLTHLLKSPLLERMEVMEKLLLIMKLFSLVIKIMSLLKVFTTQELKVN